MALQNILYNVQLITIKTGTGIRLWELFLRSPLYYHLPLDGALASYVLYRTTNDIYTIIIEIGLRLPYDIKRLWRT